MYLIDVFKSQKLHLYLLYCDVRRMCVRPNVDKSGGKLAAPHHPPGDQATSN